MVNIFRVSHILLTYCYFAEITAKYEKRGKYWPYLWWPIVANLNLNLCYGFTLKFQTEIKNEIDF